MRSANVRCNAFAAFRANYPLMIEAASECFGTIWIVTHLRSNAFDMEDVRVMRSLAAFSAMACLSCRAHHGEGRYEIPFLRSAT